MFRPSLVPTKAKQGKRVLCRCTQCNQLEFPNLEKPGQHIAGQLVSLAIFKKHEETDLKATVTRAEERKVKEAQKYVMNLLDR